jgi:hypothetical protein
MVRRIELGNKSIERGAMGIGREPAEHAGWVGLLALPFCRPE